MASEILKDKRILAVDDEPDVLDTLEEILTENEGLVLDRAQDYETGYHLLRSWTYDAVILDIMGVRGFDLLNASVHLGFPTVMLTAHAFSAADLKQAVEMGARAYIPKEKMFEIPAFLEDVPSTRSSARSGWRTKRASGSRSPPADTSPAR
ncbi:MAG: response regulator [Desulfobacterales bacterium]|nr:response regulator [Desulfobacterales bacterium]